jgi:penicillin-binding protein 1C
VTVSGELAGHRLLLDKRDIGDAASRPLIMAGPGAHRLMLVDPAGKVVDQALFTIR